MERRYLGAALLAATALAGLVSACSGDDSSAVQSSTPAASPSAAPAGTAARTPAAAPTPADELVFRFPPPGPCPLPQQADICDFALELADAVRGGDADAVAARARPLPIQCPDVPQTVLFGSVCEGHWGQAVLAIYAAKWGGGAAFLTPAQMRESISERLTADAAVGGVGCSRPDCELAVVAIVFPSPGADGVLLVQVLRNSGSLGIIGLLNWAPGDDFVRGQAPGLPIAFQELRSDAASLTFQPWTPQ
jgi:hypothetical protein